MKLLIIRQTPKRGFGNLSDKKKMLHIGLHFKTFKFGYSFYIKNEATLLGGTFLLGFDLSQAKGEHR
jgi:hypothetical protein